jgi:hypothetical protein
VNLAGVLLSGVGFHSSAIKGRTANPRRLLMGGMGLLFW